MTRREAAIISAYTGILTGDFGDMHAYIEEILGRDVWTHELASESLCAEIKQKPKNDFIEICRAVGAETKEGE